MAVSIALHLMAAALAGAVLPDVKKSRPLNLEVDLRLLAPVRQEKKAPPEPKKPLKRPEPKHEKPEPRPEPQPRPAPEPEEIEKPESEQPEKEVEAERARGDAPEEGQESEAAAFLESYKRVIYQKIYEARRYPVRSRLNREEGPVTVRFVILDDGSVEGLSVMESSGHSLLDRAALEAVERAAPFPPLAGDAGLSRLPVVVPVRFTLR